ncbi:DNA-directed RNA polymerase subunit beta' [Patescibacteria group bacterium]
MKVSDLESIKIKIASPEDILGWSRGEITKPETINYRTQRAEKDGLFCEKIFGPEKDYECYCGKYRRIRYKGIVCDRCGVEVTKSSVRRDRMGHIKLASPCSHIWFLRGVPSRIGMVLDIPMHQLEKLIYFASYIITSVDEEGKKRVLNEIEKEYKSKVKNQKEKGKKGQKAKLEELRVIKDKVKEEVNNLKLLRTLSEIEYHDLSLKYGEVFEAGTGAETMSKIYEKLDLKKEIEKIKKEIETISPPNKRKTLRRLKFLEGMLQAGIKPQWMFLTVLPVLPPDLRPMVQLDGGRYASSDLNDLYRRVINRNTRLKYLLDINAPDVIVRNEKRMLQEAVDALIDNGMRKGTTTQATTGGRRLLKSLADMLKGKQGRFRQNLLGKRVDYSGRSVIVVGPELKLHQCGLPKQMALELFKPFVIRRILERELAYNVRGASRLIEEKTDEVWAILEEEVENKLVLLNRAPTLHRLGIQAFQPVLIEGESIRIHPLVCKAFNADFDGDQMAVHLPLSNAAQKEAKEIMLSTRNLLKPATGTPVVSLNQDIALGCYWMTKIDEAGDLLTKIFGSPEEAILTNQFEKVGLKEKIKVRGLKGVKKDEFIETSVGRIIFNEALPDNFSFQNIHIKVKNLEKITSQLISKYGLETTDIALDKIKNLGFEYSTMSGISWGIDDLITPPQKKEIIDGAEKELEQVESHYKKGLLTREEKSAKVIEVWIKAKSEIEKLVPKALPKNGSVFQIVDSGARGSWSQPVQMAGMKGLVINPAGQIMELPVINSFKEGFDVLEYFISTHGARKGTADTALRTSTAGYLTRRLIDVAHEVITFENDCKTIKGLEMFRKSADDIGQNFLFKIVGRITLEDIKTPVKEGKRVKTIIKAGELIDWEKGEKIINSEVKKVFVRSPLTCGSTRGVCQKCYGWDLGCNELVELGQAVGTVAAQAIGEPGTQLTMKTFHTGGVAGGGDITMGLPRVQEVFETRIPGGKAEISTVDGKVVAVTSDRIVKIKPEISKTEGKRKIKNKEEEIIEYQIPPKCAIFVSSGQQIFKGDPLCEGSLDLKELFKTAGSLKAQNYIINEIQKIYVSQGAQIHDKHVEIIVRQMFSRIKVKDSGGSNFTPGEVVERSKFLEVNHFLKEAGKDIAKGAPVLLGISRVALTTDSFLSAASFQETSRVLIKASLEGKEDKLKGLKENVIIGKLIPAGTGFKKKE